MTGRGLARLLAPLALVTTIVALFLIVSSGGGDGSAEQAADGRPAATPTPARARETGRGQGRENAKTYTVKAGDTPSGIAESTGVPLDRLLELNPDVDPQLLSPGQKLKLEE